MSLLQKSEDLTQQICELLVSFGAVSCTEPTCQVLLLRSWQLEECLNKVTIYNTVDKPLLVAELRSCADRALNSSIFATLFLDQI